MRHPLALLTVLALIAIGAAGAHDWPAAPSAEQPQLSAIDLRPGQQRAVVRTKVRAAAKRQVAGRVRRKKPRRARAPLRRRAATPAGRGVSPNPAPAGPRSDDDYSRGARPARAPDPVPAGANSSDGGDEGGIVGGEDDDDGGDGNSDD